MTNEQNAPVYEALCWIARHGCENYVKPHECRQDPARSRSAQYAADAWCDACVALEAIDAIRLASPAAPREGWDWFAECRRALEDVSTEMRATGRGDSRFVRLIESMPSHAAPPSVTDADKLVAKWRDISREFNNHHLWTAADELEALTHPGHKHAQEDAAQGPRGDRPSDAAIACEFWKRWVSSSIHMEAAHELQRMFNDAIDSEAK